MVERDEPGAYRAAGQLVAALAEGMPIASVSVRGIVLKAPSTQARRSRHGDVLADLAIGLGGIAASNRYRFGTPPPNDSGQPTACVHWAFNAVELADWKIARELIAMIDPDDEQDILLLAWEQALDLVEDDATWEAVEFFAPLIAGGELDGADIDYLCPDES